VRLESEAAAAALGLSPHTERDLADFAAAPDAANRLHRRWAAKEAHAKRLGYARRADPVLIETQADGRDRLKVNSAEEVSNCRLRSIGGRIEALAL